MPRNDRMGCFKEVRPVRMPGGRVPHPDIWGGSSVYIACIYFQYMYVQKTYNTSPFLKHLSQIHEEALRAAKAEAIVYGYIGTGVFIEFYSYSAAPAGRDGLEFIRAQFGK